MKRQGTKIRFVFESARPEKNFFIREFRAGSHELAGLFPASPSIVVIHVFENRASFLKAIKRKNAPDWLVAFVPPKSTSAIYVFDDKEASFSKKKLAQVLRHEMTHLYTNKLNPSLPDWMKEGLSVYVASQIFKLSISDTDWKHVAPKDMPFARASWKYAAEHDGYNIAGLLVMYLVRRYGWKALITALGPTHPPRFYIANISSYFGDDPKELIANFKRQFVKKGGEVSQTSPRGHRSGKSVT